MKRKVPLETNEVYHIFNKSIAKYLIFNDDVEFNRILDAIKYYQRENPPVRLHRWLELKDMRLGKRISKLLKEQKKLVQIIAYCLIPTHFHFILKQTEDNGISNFISKIENSYAKYFNSKHKRKGPLWEGKFKNRLVKTDEQLIHLTRYVHLNSVTIGLIDKPEEWKFSSYKEYLNEVDDGNRICEYNDILSITPDSYRKFAEDRISYQKELAKIKNLILE